MHDTPSCPIPQHAERVDVRRKTFERTTVVHAGQVATAHVLNVSESGAQLHSSAHIPSGSHVRVDLAGKEVSGSVVWANAGRFGVRFVRKLASEDVERLLR